MRYDFYEMKDAASGQFSCFDCAAVYALTAEEQRWYQAKGFQLPKRYERCRAAKRERNAQRETAA
jgi:N-acetylglutamate synthase-like GNAT family acetyltransferase